MQGRLLFNVHSIAGLLSGLFILLMSLSGAALIFHADVDALQAPLVGPTKVPLKMLTVDSCYTVVQHKYPKAMISSCSIANGSHQAFSFIVYDSSYQNGSTGLQLFIHPVTGNILQSKGINDSFMSWLSKFHNSFHLGKTGEWLLGFFALIFLLSILTGVILFRKKISAVLLFSRSVYKGNNLHQIIAVWALVFNLMVAVTGFWMQRYVFKIEFYQSYDYTPVLKASPALSFKFDSAYAEIKKKYPDFTAAIIYFAQSSSGKTAVYGSRASNAYIHSKKFADVIMLDSAGAISKTRMINENSAADKYDIINSQLHMGRFGGIGIKIIYFVFGLSGGLLSITGFLLWWRRRKRS